MFPLHVLVQSYMYFLGEILAERARVDVGPSIFDYCHVMQLKNAGKFNRAMESTGGA